MLLALLPWAVFALGVAGALAVPAIARRRRNADVAAPGSPIDADHAPLIDERRQQ
jgi:hypothetical protein